MNLDLILKLDDKFNSIEFKKIRSKASNAILSEETDNKFVQVEDVFDFFETLGYFVKHKALDKKIVWHTFYGWVHSYWSVGKDYILSERKEEIDKTLWEDFQWLHNELLKIERINTKKSIPEILSREEIVKFFNNEP